MSYNKMTKQAVVTPQPAINGKMHVEELALFNADGTPFAGVNLAFAPVVTATAIGTAAKTTTSPEPSANSLFPLKFTNGNSAASATVAFNGGTARAVQLGGVAPTGAELTVAANGVALFWFDGTILHQLGVVA